MGSFFFLSNTCCGVCFCAWLVGFSHFPSHLQTCSCRTYPCQTSRSFLKVFSLPHVAPVVCTDRLRCLHRRQLRTCFLSTFEISSSTNTRSGV
ncbi:hypothetical protein M758_4G115700 [Ceratodon purpureus]|uniref:Secreted protein n=1 Tax=Ceratodon purpureus TaxID=3225 RepID=A0A8T0I9S4_CERPU|nr:hypothetical protein KC19_4G116000 [Ceratodon purpureus]KAG0619090.1 hypothetical protein M758_4G115700 [Ceratodon purpureus]